MGTFGTIKAAVTAALHFSGQMGTGFEPLRRYEGCVRLYKRKPAQVLNNDRSQRLI